MDFTVEPQVAEWLFNKNVDILTVGVIISRGGGCCGGCAYAETIIDYGPPKLKPDQYRLYESKGLKIYVAELLVRKAEQLTLQLKGRIFKRLALRGYEPRCAWK